MKGFSRVFCGAAGLALSFGLLACGDTVENTTINQMGMEVVDSEGDLPKCSDENEGDVAFVKDEDASRVCVDGDWKPVSSNGSGDFSCKTVELKDGSGLKIVCNGDSIGVVLNGSDGKAGKDGKDGADGEDGEDGKDAVLPQDTLENDSERVAISLDSLTGFTQKGPFLKGSTVYLYELSDGRTLKQTNGNFTSKITSDDGRYKFSARDLVSQYAMVVVDGYYRNEVTGGTSDAPIRLTALTDMRKRSSVNVNLLTHMEFDRVYNLVTHGDSTGKKLTVKAAKRQAQKEILKQFHIELDENTDAEDMDVFGDSDADAALLAVSVLLQGDSSSSALSVLLTEISNDISGYGEWKNAATKAKLADWALTVDSLNKLSVFGKNVTDWGLGAAPDFAKFVRRYSSIESGLGVCGEGDNKVGVVKQVSNPRLNDYYAETYDDVESNVIRFACIDTADVRKWRIATDIEKDTMTLGHDRSEGEVIHGVINSMLPYVYENGNWRHGTDLDDTVSFGCIQAFKDSVAKGKDEKWYKCVGDTTEEYVAKGYKESEWKSAWRLATNLEKDTVTWGHSASEGDFNNGRINSNLTYVYENGDWRHGTELDSILKKGCTAKRIDTLMKVSAKWYKCVDSTMQYVANGFVESEWGSAWRPIAGNELDTSYWKLYKNTSGDFLVGPYSGDTIVWDADTIRKPNKTEIRWNWACVSYIRNYNYRLGNQRSYYACLEAGWTFNKSLNTSSFRDSRDSKVYKSVTIGNQTWMAENLNYRYIVKRSSSDSSSFCYENSLDSCAKRGRLYVWSAAMDSAGIVPGNSPNKCGYKGSCTVATPVRGVCPNGWHLPSRAEFDTLIEYVGGIDSAGYYLKSDKGWFDYYQDGQNMSGNGADVYAFSAFPGGLRSTNEYMYPNSSVYFWTSTVQETYDYEGGAYWDGFDSKYLRIRRSDSWSEYLGYSVRCVQD